MRLMLSGRPRTDALTLFILVAVTLAGPGARAAAADQADHLVAIDNGLLRVVYDKNQESFAIHAGDRCFATGERFLGASDIEVEVRDVEDALGAGRTIVERDAFGITITLTLYEGLPFVCFGMTVHNAWDAPLVINELEPVALQLDLGRDPAALNILGCDGLTPATETRNSYTFVAVADPEDRAGVVCGWLTQHRGSGTVKAELEDGQVCLVGEANYGGKLVVLPSGTVQGETLAVGYFTDALVGLEAYADAIATANRITLPPVPSGYCTWYHAGAASEARMARLAQFCVDDMRGFGFDIVQIDDGWQRGVPPNRRDFTDHRVDGPYPSGMKTTADTLAGQGFRAGLWLIPFGWDHTAPALADHPEWFVHRPDGSIFTVDWGGDCLDMSHPGARAFLDGLVRRMTREWGYTYLKIDGLWTGMAVKLLYPEPTYRLDGLGEAVFHDSTKTNVEVYRDGLRLVREAAGDGVYILGCNIAQNMRTLGASMGLVDGMRVGRDIGADWAAILPSAQIGTHLYFLHGKVWNNDPDCLMVRRPLTLDQARAWGSWIGVSGQMNLVSEWLPKLPPERLDVVKRTMPNHQRLGRPIDLFEAPMPRIWHLEIQQAGVRWDVLGLFNWDVDEPAEITVDLAEIGRPAGADDPYLGYDYWENEFIPPFTGRRTFRLRPSSCRVVTLHRQLDRPQLVGTSRHVTQGAVDLVAVAWDDDAKILRGTSRVVARDPYELRIATPGDPAAWRARAATTDGRAGVSIAITEDGPLVRAVITSPETREVDWQITF